MEGEISYHSYFFKFILITVTQPFTSHNTQTADVRSRWGLPEKSCLVGAEIWAFLVMR